jgi:hypothetical protein
MSPSPSAQRVKKRQDQVIAPYNASMMIRFQSGGSVLAPRHFNSTRHAPCVCREPESNSDGSTDPRQLLRSVFAVRQNLTLAGLGELMIDKFLDCAVAWRRKLSLAQ